MDTFRRGSGARLGWGGDGEQRSYENGNTIIIGGQIHKKIFTLV